MLGLVVAGKLNKQIAFELDVSMTTVKAHVSAILAKLNVYSRTQAVITRRGQLTFEGQLEYARADRNRRIVPTAATIPPVPRLGALGEAQARSGERRCGSECLE